MCIQLNLDSLVYDKTNEILKGYDVQIGETIINQKGLAAGAVYIGTILEGDRRTQKEVANAARISVSTVYKYYRLLAEKVDIEIIL
jgi:transcription initiation factor TFIIB